MAACQGSTCRGGREPCLSPERCGLFNEPSLLSPQERRAFAWIDRWGARFVTALVIGAVIALFVVANWPMLRRALN